MTNIQISTNSSVALAAASLVIEVVKKIYDNLAKHQKFTLLFNVINKHICVNLVNEHNSF